MSYSYLIASKPISGEQTILHWREGYAWPSSQNCEYFIHQWSTKKFQPDRARREAKLRRMGGVCDW